jgi:putative hemolysin
VKASKESIRLLVSAPSQYAIRLARTPEEVQAAQSLRFQVFNLELNEGLTDSYNTGLDADPFDAVCDHLLVEHVPSGQIVGTYRLQTGPSAARHLGYYCQQEFDFSPYESIRHQIVELGRACVHRQHRNLFVLGLLWKSIAEYAGARGGRYLIGCSSLTSQEPCAGASAYTELCRNHLAEPRWRTKPLVTHECPLDAVTEEPTSIPKLLRAYLLLGAKICGAPAIDRQFKTIDFLTLLDTEMLSPATRERFFS